MGMKPRLSAIEKGAQMILQQWDAGYIDNPWDIYDDVVDTEKLLPRTSALRPDWDSLYDEFQKSFS